MNTLIENSDVLLFDGKKVFIEKKNIGIEDGKIKYIGKIPKEFTPKKIIDGTNKLTMPGLINTHTHLPMSLLRNYADDMDLWEWLTEKIWPIESKIRENEVYWGTLLSIAELIMSGVTCYNDMYYFEGTVAKATQESKIRGNIAIPLLDATRNDEVIYEHIKKFHKKWHNSNEERIKILLGPHSPYTCSPEYLKQIIKWAKEFDLPIHIHLSESVKEVEDSIENFSNRPVKHLDDLGLFEVKTLAAHCVQLSKEDIEILKNKNVNVLNNPGSNLKLANGFAPVQKLLKSNVNVCLGTDGSSSNNNVNMFEEINLAALINKGCTGDSKAVTASEAILMGTINGAKALGIDNKVGSITVGKQADIILIDLDKPHLYPRHNLVSSLAYSVQASDVHTVMVDGNILMENRELKTIDFKEVKKNVELCCKELIKE